MGSSLANPMTADALLTTCASIRQQPLPFLLFSSPSEHKQAQENETQKTETYNFAQQPMRMLLVKANDIVPASKRPEIFGNLEQLDRFRLQRGEEPGRQPVGDG
jgi:hypothetical protein